MPPVVVSDYHERRLGEAAAALAEITNVIAFLASDYSSYLTREVVSVSYLGPSCSSQRAAEIT